MGVGSAVLENVQKWSVPSVELGTNVLDSRVTVYVRTFSYQINSVICLRTTRSTFVCYYYCS